MNSPRFIAFVFGVLFLASNCIAEPSEEELLEALGRNPSDPWALYNLGLERYLDQKYFEAIELLGKLVELEPDDWEAREKLIQALSGAGQDQRVAEEVAVLRQDWSSGEHEKLVERGFFIRDQFEAEGFRIFAFEYFELAGERALVWKFFLKQDGQNSDRWISLGSYESTNEIMRGNGDIAAGERAYHLDGYWENGSHATYHFFRERPEYAAIREMVENILNDSLRPFSSTVPVAPDKESESE